MIHHPYVNGGGDGIGKNHNMDKCQQDRLMYQTMIAMSMSKLKYLFV